MADSLYFLGRTRFPSSRNFNHNSYTVLTFWKPLCQRLIRWNNVSESRSFAASVTTS